MLLFMYLCTYTRIRTDVMIYRAFFYDNYLLKHHIIIWFINFSHNFTCYPSHMQLYAVYFLVDLVKWHHCAFIRFKKKSFFFVWNENEILRHDQNINKFQSFSLTFDRNSRNFVIFPCFFFYQTQNIHSYFECINLKHGTQTHVFHVKLIIETKSRRNQYFFLVKHT